MSIKLKLIDLDKFCEKLPEVKSHKIYENGKFSKFGLFSQQIFGPVQSYRCACGKFNGRKYKNKICPSCSVKVENSLVRRKYFGKINLPFEVLNPIFYFLVLKIKLSAKHIINNLLSYKDEYYLTDSGELITASVIRRQNVDPPANSILLTGLDGCVTYIEHILKNKKTETSQYILKHFDQIKIKNILVLPPDDRPLLRNNSDVNFCDEINKLYKYILVKSSQMKEMSTEYSKENEIYKNTFKFLQEHVLNLYKYIFDKLSKKTGLIRSNILGKRVDFSGRAVISPNPDISLDECKIPYIMLLEIYKPHLTKYLVNRRIGKRYNVISKYIDECIINEDTSLFKYVEDFCQDKVCILNRQPSLHRLSILGFKIKPHLGKTIQIHPLVCVPLNADFDGDCMAIYVPIEPDAQKDIIDKIMVTNNTISPANGEVVTKPNQDVVLGLFFLTKDDKSKKMVEYSKIINDKEEKVILTQGRALFNDCLPLSYPAIINTPITKKILDVLLNRIIKYCGKEDLAITLDKIKKLGFEQSTKNNFSLSVKDLYDPNVLVEKKNLTGNIQTDLDYLNNEELLNKMKNMKFGIYIDSGARGSWTQAQQLVFARGYVADDKNKIKSDIIKSSLIEGMTQKDFFNSCWGVRKGLLDTAISTGSTGYLTRQLIYSNYFIELDVKTDDCGTTDYLPILLGEYDSNKKLNIEKTKILINSLDERYYLDEETQTIKLFKSNSEEIKKLIGKTVLFRSPIYCQNKKICKTCYGEKYKIMNTSQVGIVAVHSISERIMQLVLRSFHISGAASKSTDSGENEDIVNGMTIINRFLHKPNMICPPTEPEKFVKGLYKLFIPFGNIFHVHLESITAAMLWTKNKKYWRIQKNRKNKEKKWESIMAIPSMKSWLIGSAFSNLKSKILDGLVESSTDEESSLSNLFRFKE